MEFYLVESPRVAAAFVEQVEAAIRGIVEGPNLFPVKSGGVRRCLVRRFPYGIYYTVEKGGVVIWAIMHLRRRPDYWRGRRED